VPAVVMSLADLCVRKTHRIPLTLWTDQLLICDRMAGLAAWVVSSSVPLICQFSRSVESLFARASLFSMRSPLCRPLLVCVKETSARPHGWLAGCVWVWLGHLVCWPILM